MSSQMPSPRRARLRSSGSERAVNAGRLTHSQKSESDSMAQKRMAEGASMHRALPS